jgi:hypothetical protein
VARVSDVRGPGNGRMEPVADSASQQERETNVDQFQRAGMRGWRKAAVCMVCLAAAGWFGGNAKGQVSTASVTGTVVDSTGAAVPGASLSLHNLGTGVDSKTQTNSSGEYVFVNVTPGSYTLRVDKTGFQSSQQAPFKLSVNQTAAFDFKLELGSAAQTVTVTASSTALEASTSELGAVVESKAVNDLPLNGRNFTQLLNLTPGASPVDTAQTFGFRGVGSYDFPSFNGARNRSSLFLVDGVIDQGSINSTYAVPLIVDDIAEFKVDSHNDQVQFGGVTGGVINVVTKSGTNEFHGTLWEFLRNSALDSRNTFFPNVQALRQNQFGANFGGPVELPHYNGKNRTFFFVSYEGFRESAPSQTLGLIPSQAELQGNLSGLNTPIYNPFSTHADLSKPGQYLRDPFPGGVIPASLLDPTMNALAQRLYPQPTVSATRGTNFVATTPNATDQNVYDIRLDQQFGTKDAAWFRFSSVNLPATSISPIGQASTNDTWTAHTMGANWSHTFGPSAVMQAQFGRTYAIDNTTGSTPGVSSSLIAQFDPNFACGFPGSRSCLLPSVSLVGFLGTPGDTLSSQGATDTWSGQVNFSKLVGRHILTFGFDVNTNNIGENIQNDSVAFSPFQTANLESPGGTGSALASFLLGVPDGGSRRLQVGGEHGGWVDGAYFGDQWKATDRLTVNIGVRWDVTLHSQWGEAANRTNQVGTLDLNNGTYILQVPAPFCSAVGSAPCIPGSALPAHVVIAQGGSIFRNYFNNIGPRLGLAYRLDSKTVIRTGGGIFYDNWSSWSQVGQSYGATWPQVTLLTTTNLNLTSPTVRAESPVSTVGAGALPAATPFTQNQFYKDPFMQTPYSEQWNFGIQRELTPTTVLSLDYVGSHSSRLSLSTYGNTAVTPGPGPQVDRRPYPYITPTEYERSDGRSSYEALQVSLNKKFGNGLTGLLSYTYSKSIDISCSGYAAVEGCANQNPYDVNADKSVSAFDLTHVFTGSVVYDLPFGAGKRFSTGSQVLNYVLGNWQVNTIVSLRSGLPYTLGVSGDIANTGNANPTGPYERLNLIGDPYLTNPTPAAWLNKAAFAVPAPFTYGNLGRNTFRSDWGRNIDFSLFRDFPIHESIMLEFRAEAFNLTNTAVYGIPVSNYSSPNFAQVLNIANTPRQLQFALKLYF